MSIASPKICVLQYVRAIAALGVVLYHLQLWEYRNLGEAAITGGWMRIGDVGVDLFFVISGFIMVYIQPKRLESWRSYFRFLFLRMSRVYAPYWIVALALLPVWLLAPHRFNNYYDNQMDILRSILLLPQDFQPLLACAWTLIHEVYFYFAVSIVFLFQKRALLGSVWFLVVLAVAVGFQDTPFGDHRILQTVFSPFSLTFLLGYFIGLNHSRIRRLPIWCFGAALIVGGGCLGWANHLDPHFLPYPSNHSMLRFWVYGIPSALVVVGALGLEQILIQPQRWLNYLGDISYATYLVHLPVIAGVYAISKKYLLQYPVLIWPTAIGVMALIYMASIVFHKWFEIPSIRYFRRRIEQRFPAKLKS